MGACVQCDAKLAGLTDREHRAEDLGVPDGVLRRLDAQHRRLIEVPPSPRRRWPAAREALHQRQCERPRECWREVPTARHELSETPQNERSVSKS